MSHTDRAWQDYSATFRQQVLPKLLDSAVCLSIGAPPGTLDVQQATELGAILLYDKPLLVVVPRGRQVGERLRRAADVVLDDWAAGDPEAEQRLVAALAQLTGR